MPLDAFMVKGSTVDGWAGPCLLPKELLAQRCLSYDAATFDLVGAASAVLGLEGVRLGEAHTLEPAEPSETPPQLQQAQVQARMVRAPDSKERGVARRRFKNSAAWQNFLALYRKFVHEWVVPQFGGVELLYQASPVLRVVMPGSVPPCKPHCDADYFHDPNEINYWVALSPVWGNNSLWAESEPGAGDYAPFELGPGQVVRWYGNRCRHYTCDNDTDGTRVSIDFRVIPRWAFVPPAQRAGDAKVQTQYVLDVGDYYALARPAGRDDSGGGGGTKTREPALPSTFLESALPSLREYEASLTLPPWERSALERRRREQRATVEAAASGSAR